MRSLVAGAVSFVALGTTVISGPVEAGTVSDHEVCKATIASIFNKKPKIIENKGATKDVVFVHYYNQSDREHHNFKCKVGDGEVVWGNRDGRWRDSKWDPSVRYNVSGKTIIIREKYNDGTKSKESISISNLR